MTASRRADGRVGDNRPTHLWWVFLILGILWVLIAFVVLAGSPTSVATIGFLMGGVLIAAGLTEAVEATATEGWRWLHVALAVLFIATGVLPEHEAAPGGRDLSAIAKGLTPGVE